MVVLWSVYVAVRPAKTLVVYYSSAFILRIECTNCNIKPVGVKPSLQLQQLTLRWRATPAEILAQRRHCRSMSNSVSIGLRETTR